MALPTAAGMVLVGIGLWSNWHRAGWYASDQVYADDKKIAFAGTALLVVVAVTTGTAGFAAQQSALESALGRSLPESLKSRAAVIHSEMARAVAKADTISRRRFRSSVPGQGQT